VIEGMTPEGRKKSHQVLRNKKKPKKKGKKEKGKRKKEKGKKKTNEMWLVTLLCDELTQGRKLGKYVCW